MEDDRKPWWADDPELAEVIRSSLEELEREPDRRELADPDGPDPVVAEIFSGASSRELAEARDDLARARARYDEAVRAARIAGLSWGEIGRMLGVPKQALHRRFRARSPHGG